MKSKNPPPGREPVDAWLDDLLTSAPPIDPSDPGPQEEFSPETGPQPEMFSALQRTDIANTDRFVEACGQDFLYCYDRRAWLSWIGQRWSWEHAQGALGEATEQTARAFQRKAEQHRDIDKHLAKWATDSCSIARRNAMVTGAQHRLPVLISALDKDEMVLNTPTSTVDLRTGSDHHHQRVDRLTKMAGASFRPRSSCPTWHRFLEDIFPGDAALKAFLQRAVGYSLTGSTDEQVMFLCVGHTGANGKSVFSRVLGHVAGDYARTISFQIFLQDRFGGKNKRPELAELLGVRVGVALEPDAGSQIDESVIKTITGGDELVGERKYEAPFSFKPVVKLWLSCNTPPRLPRGGSSMMRRILVVPFDIMIPEEDRDLRLSEKLEAEADGILAWAVEGCLEWQRRGLAPPDRVRLACEEYQADSDPLAKWIAGYLHKNELSDEPLDRCHESYREWAEGQGLKPVSQLTLKGMLKGRGYKIKTTGSLDQVVGVIVRQPADEGQEQAARSGQVEMK